MTVALERQWFLRFKTDHVPTSIMYFESTGPVLEVVSSVVNMMRKTA